AAPPRRRCRGSILSVGSASAGAAVAARAELVSTSLAVRVAGVLELGREAVAERLSLRNRRRAGGELVGALHRRAARLIGGVLAVLAHAADEILATRRLAARERLGFAHRRRA